MKFVNRLDNSTLSEMSELCPHPFNVKIVKKCLPKWSKTVQRHFAHLLFFYRDFNFLIFKQMKVTHAVFADFTDLCVMCRLMIAV